MANLTNEAIEKISQENEQFLTKGKVNPQEIIKIKLNIENALLEWQGSLGPDTEVAVSRTRFLGKRNISFRCKGNPCNPLVNTEFDEWNSWMGSFASSLNKPPKYEYINGENKLSFEGNKQKKSLILLLVYSIIIGLVIGFAGFFVLSEEVRVYFCNVFLKPVYTTYLNVCGLFGIPLIFLSVMNGIIGVGNIKTFSTIGTKMIRLFLRVLLILTVVTVVVGLKVFSPEMTSQATGLVYSDVISLFLDIFPTGLFQPFIDCNAIQLIVLGLGFGIAILQMDKTQGPLSQGMVNIQDILLLFSSWVSSFIPLFITVGFVDTIWRSSFYIIRPVLKSFVTTTGLEILIVVILVVFISIKYKVGLKTVIGKVSKVFLISLGTDSCVASVSENYSCCSTKLGISNKVFSFGIPIGTTIFKPATALRLVLLCFYMVKDNSMNISVSWLLILTLLSICVSIACPAIPGGVLMLCGILFSNLGIPTESITQMLTTDVFFDCFCTAVNQIAVSLMLTIYAGKVGLLDVDTLRKK